MTYDEALTTLMCMIDVLEELNRARRIGIRQSWQACDHAQRDSARSLELAVRTIDTDPRTLAFDIEAEGLLAFKVRGRHTVKERDFNMIREDDERSRFLMAVTRQLFADIGIPNARPATTTGSAAFAPYASDIVVHHPTDGPPN